MTTSLWLRIAALVTLLYCAGHTMGMPWTPATGSQETAVIDAMKSARFDALGSERTYWQFYFGFGLIISGYLAVQSVVLWLMAGLAKRDSGRLRPIIAAFFISFALNAVVVWKFFFSVPFFMAIAASLSLALAFALARSGEPDKT
jgi:hypothetical protein